MACNHTKKPCGCTDYAYVTNTPCEGVNCPEPNPCQETFDACCVIYTGPDIVNANIKTGDSMCDVIQKLIIYGNSGTTPATCLDPTNCCASPLGLTITAITNNSISISWDLSDCPEIPGYIVEYKVSIAPSWTTTTPVSASTNTYTISGLSPDTNYYIRIRTSCETEDPCYSVTLLARTLSN
jgi:hypothetical protein